MSNIEVTDQGIIRLKSSMVVNLKQLKKHINLNDWVNFDRTIAYLKRDRDEVATRQILEMRRNEKSTKETE